MVTDDDLLDPPPWVFSPHHPQPPGRDSQTTTHAVDLTDRSGTGAVEIDLEPDAVDRALAAAVATEPMVIAGWRTWRWPTDEPKIPIRIVLVAVRTGTPEDELPALAVRLQQVVTEAVGPDEPLPDWPVPVEDRALILDPEERSRIVERLMTGILVRSAPLITDLLDPEVGEAVPLTVRTDGHWAWSEAVAYYLEVHRLAPEPQFLAYLRALEPEVVTPGPVDHVRRHQVLAALQTPAAAAGMTVEPPLDPAWAERLSLDYMSGPDAGTSGAQKTD